MLRAADPFENKPENFTELARLMSRMWSSFIYRLDPNDSGGTLGSEIAEVVK
jgi:hypothetical protein